MRKIFLKSGLPTEKIEQGTVIKFLRESFPTALFTIAPNGFRLHPRVARDLKDMGYRAGTPDILIFEPRAKYHGLFIEMKAQKGGVISPEQKAFIFLSRANGYAAAVCAGAQEAIPLIGAYLKMGEFNEKK